MVILLPRGVGKPQMRNDKMRQDRRESQIRKLTLFQRYHVLMSLTPRRVLTRQYPGSVALKCDQRGSLLRVLRVEFLLKTESGYLRDAEVT